MQVEPPGGAPCDAAPRPARGGPTVVGVLGVIGWVLSWWFMGRWLLAHGGRFFAGWVDAFTASTFATGLLLDLVVVTVMMVAVAVIERRRVGTRVAVAMVASLSLSVSVSLAIYLVALWRDRSRGA